MHLRDPETVSTGSKGPPRTCEPWRSSPGFSEDLEILLHLGECRRNCSICKLVLLLLLKERANSARPSLMSSATTSSPSSSSSSSQSHSSLLTSVTHNSKPRTSSPKHIFSIICRYSPTMVWFHLCKSPRQLVRQNLGFHHDTAILPRVQHALWRHLQLGSVQYGRPGKAGK